MWVFEHFLVAKKWDSSQQRQAAGRPRTEQAIVECVLRMARENPSWGSDRIQGALRNLGHQVSDRTVGNSQSLRSTLQQVGVESVILPPRSPNLSAQLERFFGSLKAECLNRMIFFGEDSLRRAVTAYLDHYHTDRNHQSLDNSIIMPGAEVGRTVGDVACRERYRTSNIEHPTSNRTSEHRTSKVKV